jgi:hypothetical protein
MSIGSYNLKHTDYTPDWRLRSSSCMVLSRNWNENGRFSGSPEPPPRNFKGDENSGNGALQKSSALMEARLRDQGLLFHRNDFSGAAFEAEQAVDLLSNIQETIRRRDANGKRMGKLRFLLCPGKLSEGDREWVRGHMEGVKWLGEDGME